MEDVCYGTRRAAVRLRTGECGELNDESALDEYEDERAAKDEGAEKASEANVCANTAG
mgnify:FL=1|jgi:hypothetical protein